MIWLQSVSRFQELAHLTPTTSEFKIVPRTQLPEGKKTAGTFAYLGQTFAALYLDEEEVFLRIGDNVFPVQQDLKIQLEKNGKKRLLRIIAKGGETIETPYTLSEDLQDELTAFSAEEDDDYGLYLYNMVNDQSRQDIMRSSAMPTQHR